MTDHNPLTFLQTQPTLSRRQARWMEYLTRFHYTWVYRPGRVNVAEPISRNPSLNAMTRAQANRQMEAMGPWLSAHWRRTLPTGPLRTCGSRMRATLLV